MNDNNSKSFNERLGRNIRAVRLLQGKKLEEVADRLPVTYQQLQRYEAGIDGLSVQRLEEIAQVLGTQAARLMPLQGAPSEADMTPRVLHVVAGVENLPSDRIRADIVRLIHGINLAWPRPRG